MNASFTPFEANALFRRRARFSIAAALIALALIAMLTGTVRAAAPALQGQVTLRPLTPQEIKDYALTNVQGASGLNTVGVGQPVYLEVLVSAAVPNSDITNVVWTLSGETNGTSAALTASPLGSNVPPFKVADRFSSSGAPLFKVAARTTFRTDQAGQYTINVLIQTASSGSTNLTQRITVGTYMGINTCALCHSGGVVAKDQYHPWSGTKHAMFFTKAIDGLKGAQYSKNCISCHTVGYDTNLFALNDGFDDVATQRGWTFPTNLVAGNWASLQTNHASLANLANVQCENCHGPGSEHAMALGNTNIFNWPRIDSSFVTAKCAQCHDSKPDYVKVSEWNNSLHARATRTPSGAGRQNCVRCHTAPGFKQFIENAGGTNTYATNTVYEAITCSACHDPHDATHPSQLRTANIYTLPEGTTVTNVGLGALCMNCHHSRNGEATQNITNYQRGLPTWAGGSSFGPHNSTAGDMVEGVNAITYGKTIPSGSHSAVIPNVCVGCHMQTLPSSHPGYGKAGGHSFSMTYTEVNGGVTNTVDAVDTCLKCHGPIDKFDFARKDYDGDGVIQGVQTEVQNLLNKLSRLLPNSTYRADGNYVADGLIKTPSVKTNWQAKFLQAAWNWQFVNVEGSKGVHNAPYAVGVLKASIADLTGDSNNDNLADAWQIQYFGSVTNVLASPNATPAGDGVPNWLKYYLGLNPFTAGVNIPGGFVFGPSLTNPQGTNTIQIYRAAEIVFNTVVGTTYQVQSISAVDQVWQNVGGSIAGTGGAISYVTPTRQDPQQFFRVVHTP